MDFLIPSHLHSEANIQAEFFHHARLINLPVALEVYSPVGRLDIAIFDPPFDNLLFIVECKRRNHCLSRNSWQIARYKTLGVPVYGLSDPLRAPKLASQLLKLSHSATPVPWSKISSIQRHPYFRRSQLKKFSPLNLDPDINFKS